MAAIAGDIAMMHLWDAVEWLERRKRTGTLIVHRGVDFAQFVIRQGFLCKSVSSDPREQLGQNLIRLGYIDEAGLAKAFATQEETKVPLGQVLLMVGAVQPAQMQEALRLKTWESCLACLDMQEGLFRIVDLPIDTLDLDLDAPLPLRQVLDESLHRAAAWEKLRQIFPAPSTRCAVLQDPSACSDLFERQMLELFAAQMPIGDVALEMRLFDFPAYAAAASLYEKGYLRPRLITYQNLPLPSAGTATLINHAADIEIAIDDSTPDEAAVGFGLGQNDGKPSHASSADTSDLWDHHDDDEGILIAIRPEVPEEAPGVVVPADAIDPAQTLRNALVQHDYREAQLLAQRILERDPQDAEALAAKRVADFQLRRQAELQTQQHTQSTNTTPNAAPNAAPNTTPDAGTLANTTSPPHAAGTSSPLESAAAHVLAAPTVAQILVEVGPSSVPAGFERVPILVAPRDQLAQIHMSSKERYVLSRIDGNKSLLHIAAVSPIQRDELAHIVNAFVRRGLVSFLGEPRPSAQTEEPV